MKLRISTLFLGVSIMASGLAFAGNDGSALWIAQCVADNKDEKASDSVIQKYCECMNNQMSSGEMQSISQWEETHPKERKECEAYAGWK
ncbi:MAG: hypothetical protein RKO66_13405 [Candidatus Contendobacter sp.]|nr:hypothetical protein [Candidatus Contendobacter sp.]MDS4057110.1 hypothetical protein [Candidatus Contendobacter sp.]